MARGKYKARAENRRRRAQGLPLQKTGFNGLKPKAPSKRARPVNKLPWESTAIVDGRSLTERGVITIKRS